LSLDFRELHTDSGSQPISAALTRVGKSQAGKDAAIIGGSTVGGAILGEAIDDGDGDVIGAIVGGLAGTAAAVNTRGKPLVIEAGTLLAIELQQSVTVEVAT
jgi:outer membrane lipoprotein SlyB